MTPRDGYEDTLQTRLAKVSEVDAVYVEEENGVIHVYSIVRDIGDFYDRLLAQEKAIAQAWPQTRFDFHVRVHQGRQPNQAAPFCSCNLLPMNPDTRLYYDRYLTLPTKVDFSLGRPTRK